MATWENAWERFIPFLAFPPELRKIIYTTNSIESLIYQLRNDGWRRLATSRQDVSMTAVPLDRDPDGEVARLVALARESHEQVNLTEDGETVAVVMTAEEYEGLLETLDILRNPGELADIEAGRAELARGEGIDGNTALAPFLSRPSAA